VCKTHSTLTCVSCGEGGVVALNVADTPAMPPPNIVVEEPVVSPLPGADSDLVRFSDVSESTLSC
jgi:hypothetical protein